MHFRDRILILIFLLFDMVALNISILIISFMHYARITLLPNYVILLNISWILTFLPFINEHLFTHHTLKSKIKDLMAKTVVYVAISAFLIVLTDYDSISRIIYLGSLLIFIIAKFLLSYFYSFLIKKKQKGEHYKNVLIIGASHSGLAINEFYLRNPDRGTVIGYLDNSKSISKKFNILGKVNDLKTVFNNYEVNDVIINLDNRNEINIRKIIKTAEYHGIRPRVIPDYYNIFNRNYEIRKLGDIPLINIREVKLDYYSNRFWKRAFDLIFSSFGIIFCLPFFVLIAIAIKIESKGSIFYKPIRIGKSGVPFQVLKFRSMKENDDQLSGLKSTLINDNRITKVGKVIRRASLDELPQLFNVFMNKMSIVGPRPHRINLGKEFQKTIYTYNVRQYIRPGITGWAQVNGWRGPTDKKLDFYGRTLHDIWYIENWSFSLDIYIIYLTIFGKKVRKNAF